MTLRKDERREVPFEPVTIETVDRAVRDWFDLTVAVHVQTQTAESHKVPVIFSTGERFALRKKGVRDANGVLILPLISVRRTAFDPDPSMGGLGTETSRLNVSRRVSPKSNDLRNNVQRVTSAGIPFYGPGPGAVYEVASVPFPDRNVVTYELVVQTTYTKQMNSVLQKIFQELDIRKSFVAPILNDGRHGTRGAEEGERRPDRGGYFVGFFDSTVNDQSNLEEFTDQERIIRYASSFRVPVAFFLEEQGERPAVRFEKTAYGVGFKERTLSATEFFKMFPEEK